MDSGQAGFRIVRDDVNQRNLKAFGKVTGVSGGTGIKMFRGKAQLVVGDNVNGSPSIVTPQPAHIEGFGHDSFTGESSIAVDKNRKGFSHVLLRITRLIAVILGGTGVAF